MRKPTEKKSYTSLRLTIIQMDTENPVLTTSPGKEEEEEEEEDSPRIGNAFNYYDAHDSQY